MRIKYFYSNILLMLSIIPLLNGCMSSYESQMNSLNRSLEEQHSPLRYVKTTSTKKYDAYTQEWVGTPGPSMADGSQLLKNDILKAIQEHCGLEPTSLVETRLVSHTPTEFYEVWLFKDPLSERKDGMSGLAVNLKALPNNNGTDFTVNGNCHGKPGMSFSFGK